MDAADAQARERAVGAASLPLAPGYMPRSPERTPLHRAVRAHLATFFWRPARGHWVLARRPALVGRVLAILLRALSTWQQQRGRALGAEGTAGAVTFVQRFGSAMLLNIHFHVVVPDGVFVRGDDGVVRFARLATPEDEDVELLVHRTATRVLRLLRKEVGEDEPGAEALATLEAASLSSRPPPSGEAPRPKRLTVFLEGFSLHAGLHLHANDRRGLEQLCRYGARGAIAHSRLSEIEDGRYAYRMMRCPAALGERAKLAASAAERPARARPRPPSSPCRLDWAAALKRVYAAAVSRHLHGATCRQDHGARWKRSTTAALIAYAPQ